MECLLVAAIAIVASAPESDGDGKSKRLEAEQAATEESDDQDIDAEGENESFDINIQDVLLQRQSSSDQASSAILTTASVAEIRSWGYLTLAEYLNDEVPGFRYAPGFYHRWPTIRGISGAANLLVNGVSTTSPIDYRFACDEALFLEEFDRVESISGPAGVPWGAHSLLGVVNLLVSNTAPDGTTISGEYGTRNHQRLSLRDVRTLGDGRLRLFLGYGGSRMPSEQPEWRYDGVPPYFRSYHGGRNSERLTPDNDLYATFSAHYSRQTIDVYLRLPYAKQHYQVSEFAGVLRAGQEGQRENLDGLAFVSWHDTFFSGKLALLTRAVWYRLYEQFGHALFASSSVMNASRSLQQLDLSTFSLVAEATYRLQVKRFTADVMGGANLSFEVPHSSRFFVTDDRYSDVVFDAGKVLDSEETPLHQSAYLFSEARFAQVSIAGGVRYNRSNVYESTFVAQFNAAARAFGENYLKFGFTQGMRPPTVLDRAGLVPVAGISTLKPERSQAYQAEANSAFSIEGWVKRGFLRLAYTDTQVENLIVREGKLDTPFLYNPIETDGNEIVTWEGLAQFEFGIPLSLTATYTHTTVRAPTFLNPDKTEIEPNHGPTHHGTFSAGYDILNKVTVRPSLEVQCGGTWRVVYPAEFVEKVDPVNEELGCYYFVNATIRAPSRPQSISVMLIMRNLLDARPPVATFLFPELQGAEAPVMQTRGRSIFVMLQWTPWGGDV